MPYPDYPTRTFDRPVPSSVVIIPLSSVAQSLTCTTTESPTTAEAITSTQVLFRTATESLVTSEAAVATRVVQTTATDALWIGRDGLLSQNDAASYKIFNDPTKETSFGQGFTSKGGEVASIQYSLGKWGSPTGNLVAKLYLATGSFPSAKPTGSVLATSNPVDASTLPTITDLVPVFTSFVFPSGQYQMVIGTNYFIAIDASGLASSSVNGVAFGNHFDFSGSFNPIHYGNAAVFEFGAWTADPNADAPFILFTTPQGDNAARVLISPRTASDALTTSETAARIVSTAHTATDAPSTSESVAASKSISRTATESLNIISDNIPGLNDGDPVPTWPDNSGNGNNAAQANSGQRPLFKINIINGKPVVRFDGSNDLLTFTEQTLTDFTLLVVYQTSGDCGIVCAATQNNQLLRIGEVGGASGGNVYTFYDNNGVANVDSDPLSAARTSWNIGSVVRSSSTVSWFEAGVARNTASAGIGVKAGAIGALPSASAIFTTGDISEIVLYNNALSSTNRGNVEAYLGAKYGITVAGGSAVNPPTLSGLRGWFRADALLPVISCVRILQAQRATTDAPTTSESAVRAPLSITRTATESLSTAEVASCIKVSIRTATDAPTTSESAGRIVSLHPNATDAPTTSESATRIGGLKRAATDAPSTSEVASRIVGILRSVTEALSTFEGGAGYYRVLTVDHTKVPSTQTNFPVLVNITDTTLKTVANGGHVQRSDGFDIGFFADSAGLSPLKWEIERYNGATGEIVAWVKIASLSSSSDTQFYLRYGDPSITTNHSDPVNVWTNGYLGVYHLKDGTTLNVADSTGVNNGTNHGATAATGQIDGGGGFVNASSQFIDLGTGLCSAALTFSAWVKATSFPISYNGVITRFVSGVSAEQLMVKSNGKLFCGVKASLIVSYDGTGSHTLVTGTWYHVGFTYDSTNGLKGYVNAASDNTVAANGTSNTTPATTLIGNYTVTSGFWDGTLDEVRVSNVARSADWFTTEYNNQNSPGTFITLGIENIAGVPGVSRILQALRATTDAPTISETVARLLAALRIATDAPSTSEIASRAKVTARTATDAPVTSESVGRTLQLLRATTDAPTTAEAVARTLAALRGATDSPSTSESAARILSALRIATDALSTAEFATGVRSAAGLSRTASESLVTSESASRIAALLRAAVEAPTTSESIARIVSFLRATTEALTIAQSVGRILAANRTVSDSILTADAVSRLEVLLRAATEALSTSELAQASKFGILNRNALDNLATAEAATRLLSALRSCTDNPLLSESLIRAIAFIRTTTDAPATAMTVVRLISLLRTTTEAPATSESLARTIALLKTAADNPTIAELASRLLTALRTATDHPFTAESASALKIKLGVASDSLSIAQSVARILLALRSTTDSPVTSDSVTRILIALRAATESLSAILVANQFITHQTFARDTLDALTTSELARRILQASRSTNDSLSTSEILSQNYSRLRFTTDHLFTNELATRSFLESRLGLDSLLVSDAASRLGIFNLVATDHLFTAESTHLPLTVRLAYEYLAATDLAFWALPQVIKIQVAIELAKQIQISLAQDVLGLQIVTTSDPIQEIDIVIPEDTLSIDIPLSVNPTEIEILVSN